MSGGLRRGPALRLMMAAAPLVMLATEIAARIAGWVAPSTALAGDYFFFAKCAAAGLLVAYLTWERERSFRLAAVALAALAAALWIALQPAHPWQMLTIVGAIGLGAFALRALAGPPSRRRVWRFRLGAAAIVPAAVSTMPFLLHGSGLMTMVWDAHVLAFEDALGPRFSILTVAAGELVPPVAVAAFVCYIALPAGLAYLLAASYARRPLLDPLRGFALATLLGYALYCVVPVVGPHSAFGAYPFPRMPPAGAVELRPLAVPIMSPRNGMPSLHATWALLIWYIAGALAPLARRLMRAFALLNIVGTMTAPDAHWLTDLVVAVPMSAAIAALCATDRPMPGIRAATVAVGAAMVAAWLVMLRFHVDAVRPYPALAWLFVAVSVALPLALIRRLDRAAAAAPRPVAAAALRATDGLR